MPTSRPRHTITESDDVARAFDDAHRRRATERLREERPLTWCYTRVLPSWAVATRYPRLGIARDPALEDALRRTRSLLGPAETRSAAAHIRALALRGAESVVEQAGPEADLRRRLAESHGLAPATADPRSLPRPAGRVDPADPTPASDALRWVRGKA